MNPGGNAIMVKQASCSAMTPNDDTDQISMHTSLSDMFRDLMRVLPFRTGLRDHHHAQTANVMAK
jgi:hypothetical protein